MNQTHRKHFRLVEEFTHGTLLIQSAYAPQGQTPADGDWDTIAYEWDSPQETLQALLPNKDKPDELSSAIPPGWYMFSMCGRDIITGK